MKKAAILFFVSLFFLCCKEEKDDGHLELEIVTKEMISHDLSEYQSRPSDYLGVKNILVYKLTNNTRNSYYFNQEIRSDLYDKFLGLRTKNVMLKHGSLIAKDREGDTVLFSFPRRVEFNSEAHYAWVSAKARAEGYFGTYQVNNNNFVIHPGETLFFEEVIFLPTNRHFQGYDYPLKKAKSPYKISVFMYSDTSFVKRSISRTDWQNIKTNGYKVYHGLIFSKNECTVIVD